MFSTFRTKNIHISCLFLPASISDIFPHLERKCTLISCLFLPELPGFDRYSLLSKNYELHVVPHLKRKIYTYLVCFCQRTLATIDISFGTRITNRTRFIESISDVFPHLERRIYIYLVCFCQRTLATIDIFFGTRITNRTRFIESISDVFPHLERRIYTYLVCFCQRTLATIDIPYRARIMNHTRFIESISAVFHIYNEEYAHILSVSILPAHSHSKVVCC